MTTTLRANAQELQVSTTVEENARDASQLGAAGLYRPRQSSEFRVYSSKTVLEKASFNPLFIREEQDRSRHHSAHRGGLEFELSTGTGL